MFTKAEKRAVANALIAGDTFFSFDNDFASPYGERFSVSEKEDINATEVYCSALIVTGKH